MSRTSLKNKDKTTKATASVSRVSKRPVVVFDSAETKTVKDTVLLYKIVFKTRQASLLALFFCVCFLSQPFQNLYANELPEAVVEVQPEPIVIVEEVEPIVLESAAEVIEAESALPAEEVLVSGDEASPAEVLPLETVATSTPADTIENTETTTSTSEPIEAPDGSTVPAVAETSESDSDSGSPDYSTASTSESDSGEQFVQNLHIIATVDSDTSYSFSKEECTRIEDGSFYCQEQEQRELQNDTLIAAPDADGDLEIYLVRDGEQIQISRNSVDDASPYFDEKSKTIVWHRLISDRYQIISYDPDSGEELQLTHGDINNMEPTRQGEYITWQRWVDDNWEVILYDGNQELQITDTSEHDTAPHIRGSLIIWNSRTVTGEQSLKTYDIENRSFTTIADSDGVAVSNPRMVVMYEALYENGDVIMKGFDVVTGEIIPLNAIPREMPEDIPNTDTTGETRALIQSKPSVRDTVVQNTSGGPTPTSTPPVLEPELEAGTLDLRPASSSTEQIKVENPVEDIPVLVIPPLETDV